jgi:hypothetical protein
MVLAIIWDIYFGWVIAKLTMNPVANRKLCHSLLKGTTPLYTDYR